MDRIFVDTNYFLRFLLKDVSSQSQKAKQLFGQGARGEVELFSNILVIFEVFWVLVSFYQKDKSRAVQIIKRMIEDLSFIEFSERKEILKAIELFQESSIEFEDAYHLAFSFSKKGSGLASFDKKLTQIAKKSSLDLF